MDDERLIRGSLARALEDLGYDVDQAADAAEALQAFRDEVPDVVLLDFKLPDRSGVEVLQELSRIAPRVPVVMITAHATLGGAVEAIKEGAYDYIAKPFELDEVVQTVARALEASRLREEVARTREKALADFGVNSMIAESSAMREVVRLIRRISASEATTILLLGESGVGKGLVARALHYAGTAGERPFMNITCTALPDALLESELFGHEKGAFTDARAQKKGLFELADGGTVFLDEIGDLSQGLQGKLLRFLEEKAFRRVGGARDIKVSVRIVATTNKILEKEVDAGRFRADLFYRLNVVPIVIPPLRERMEDVLPLAELFVRQFNQEFRKQLLGLDPRAARRLAAYSWPGNVRELRNAIERAVLLTEHARVQETDLPQKLQGGGPGPGADGAFDLPPQGIALARLEERLVRQALERTAGNRSRAARLLGMNRDQIRYRIEKFQIDSNPEGASL